MHRRAGTARGIRDGEWVSVTSRVSSVRGRVRLTEGIHPETVAVAGINGHWARGMPQARGRGIHFNTLIPFDLDNVDKLSSAFDSKAKVRVAPAGTAERGAGKMRDRLAEALCLPGRRRR